jgi:hypothetical protein
MTVSLEQAVAWVRDGVISDPKTALGLLWAEKIARGEW